MACSLKLEHCTRSCGCANCSYNESGLPSYIGSKEWQEENERIAQETIISCQRRQNDFFENIIPQCVKPLLNVDGIGFFVKNHFITSGHCLMDDGYVKINHQGQDMIFRKEDAITLRTIDTDSEEEQYGDIAIFPCKNTSPYLHIGMEPDEFQYTIFEKTLWIASYEHKSIDNPQKSSMPLFNTPTEIWDLSISEAKEPYLLTVKSGNSYHANFFEVTTEKKFGPGASGSPIFNDENEVIGLLVGCRNYNATPNNILFHPLYRYIFSLRGMNEDIE